MDRETLLGRARAAALRAYCPYSGFRVGAAVVLAGPEGPRVVTGANVENSSYGLTLCAERTALAAALTSDTLPAEALDPDATGPGATDAAPRPRITHVAIACLDADPRAGAEQCTPCGACRQWLAELAPDALYYIEGLPGSYRLDDLLPLAFGRKRVPQTSPKRRARATRSAAP